MAEDASRYPAFLSELVSSLVPSFSHHQQFNNNLELLSYLLLCVAKMPFIPQVSITRSVSGLTGKERSGDASSRSSGPTTKMTREGKGCSVKERLALNLRQLERNSQPKTHLNTARRVSSGELQINKRERLFQSSQADSPLTSSSGESLSKTKTHRHVNHSSKKSEEKMVKTRSRNKEEVNFTLTLTPEAVLLLQRRNGEKHQCSAARNAPGGLGATDCRRKRQQSVSQRNSRAAGRNNPDAPLGDIGSIVKISLLNEKHKYDDVEYEDEEDSGVDERVVLKCTEWLRGLENTPVTIEKRLNRTVNSLKSF